MTRAAVYRHHGRGGQTLSDALAFLLVLAWRFVTGQHMDGRRRTDATFFACGQNMLHPRWFGRGEASWWAKRSGWARAVVRLAAAAVLLGLWRWRQGTEWTLAMIGGPALGLAAVWAALRVLRWRHRRRVVEPLAAALAAPLETPPAEVARTLRVPRAIGEDARIVAAPAAQWQGAPGQVAAVTRIVGQRLGGEWQAAVQRDPLGLLVTRKPAPPARVTLADVLALVQAQGSMDRLLMGLGAGGAPDWLDFDVDLAHLGVSVGTGGGKSTFLRWVVAQWAFWGVRDFVVIDTKFVSLAGMEAIPGLRVYREAAEQWAALAEARAEMDARYAALLADPSATFPRKVIVLEEQNDAAIEWRACWAQVKGPRDPATPPVYTDLTQLMIKGRQVGIRVVGVYQRLTARACGGLDAGLVRDQYAHKALARHSPQAWDALTGITPRPAPSMVPGRWLHVAGHDVRAVQVPGAEAAELVAFALSGAPAAPPPWPTAAAVSPVPVPGVSAPERPRLVAVSRDGAAAVLPGADRPSPASTAPGLVVGLAAAAEALGMTLEGFRKARQRRPIAGELPPDAQGRPRWPAEALTVWRAERPSAVTAAEGVA